MSNWMSQLSDSKLISEINIPGTHNSASFADTTFGSIGTSNGQCQNMSFQSQLENGIRFFDLRLEKHDNDYRFCHGELISYNLIFHSVFNMFKDFLKRNSNEFIIISVKKDNGEDITSDWEEHYASDSIIYADNHFPKVSACRGKIIVLSRLYNASKGFAVDWDDNTEMQVVEKATYEYAVQDNYNVDLEQSYLKKSVINKFLDQAINAEKDRLQINFTSSAGMYSGTETFGINVPNPKDASERINPSVLEKLRGIPRGNRYGLVIMDFPSQELINTIIQSNN